MILLERGTTAFICLSLEDGYIQEGSLYLFEFENDITSQVVSVSLLANPSPQERYFVFGFDIDDYFDQNKNNGFWSYRLYESRTSPLIKRLIKSGKMKLEGEALAFTQYDGQDNEFIAYNS